MGNNQSTENSDVYTYHESVLKQGAQAAATDSSDESDDELQEGYSREVPISSNVENDEIETNSNASDDENSSSGQMSSVSDVGNISSGNIEQGSLLDHSELEDVRETENEAVASTSSTVPKGSIEHEYSEFVTPPSSPSSKETSPGPARRSTRLQLKASTLNPVSKKRRRFSMRDSDDSDDDAQYSTPSTARKTPNRTDILVESQSSSSKNQPEYRTGVQATIPKSTNETNSTPEIPSSTNENLLDTSGTSPPHNNGRPNLRSSGGEGRPFLRATRSVQMYGKNAVHLQKVVSIPRNSEHNADEVNVGVSNISNDESSSCTNSTANNSESEKVTSVTNSDTQEESEKIFGTPLIASSADNIAICTTATTSLTTEIETTILASTQNNSMSETPTNAVASNSKDKVTSISSTCPTIQHTSPEARSEGDDVIMRDVNSEKESNTPEDKINSEEFPASGSNIVQPMDIQCVENSIIDKSSRLMTKPMEVVTVNGEQPSQRTHLAFGTINSMSSTSSDLQPSTANITGEQCSFSQLANSHTSAQSIATTSNAVMLFPHDQHQTPKSTPNYTFGHTTQIHTPAPSVSSFASQSTALVVFPQTTSTSQNCTPISSPVINQRPKVATYFPLDTSSTLLSVQKCCIFPISSNFDMTIRQGNIVKQDAAAIVNSTDTHLRHQGALSRLIAETASPQMMFECQQHLMKHGGSLNILHVLDTTAGGRFNTNVERIIHVIPPSGSSIHFDHLSVNKLVSAYLQCMLHADRLLNSSSIAFPLLGAGSFPTDISINAFYSAVLIFLSDKRSLSRLNDVRLIINDPHIYQFAVDYFTSSYENILTQGIDLAVAEALDGFYGNKNSSLSSFCVKDEVDGNQSSTKKWRATESLKNLFRGPPVKRPRL